jgi:hypothetical protein
LDFEAHPMLDIHGPALTEPQDLGTIARASLGKSAFT